MKFPAPLVGHPIEQLCLCLPDQTAFGLAVELEHFGIAPAFFSVAAHPVRRFVMYGLLPVDFELGKR